MNNNQYEILPTAKSNINAYNRYPFTCYEEAVQNIMQKNLKPGEQAVAYYFDENSIIGINAITAFGNLKKQEILFLKVVRISIEIQSICIKMLLCTKGN